MEPFERSNHRLENAGGSVRGWPGEGLIGLWLSGCLSPPLPWAAASEGTPTLRGQQRVPGHAGLLGDTSKSRCWRPSPGPCGSAPAAAVSRGGRGLLSVLLPRDFQDRGWLGSKGQGGEGWGEGGSPPCSRPCWGRSARNGHRPCQGRPVWHGGGPAAWATHRRPQRQGPLWGGDRDLWRRCGAFPCVVVICPWQPVSEKMGGLVFSASSCPKQRPHSGACSSFSACHVVLLVKKGHFSKAIRIKPCGSCLSGLLRGLPRSPREPVCTRHRAEHGFPRKGVEKGFILPTCRCS